MDDINYRRYLRGETTGSRGWRRIFYIAIILLVVAPLAVIVFAL